MCCGVFFVWVGFVCVVWFSCFASTRGFFWIFTREFQMTDNALSLDRLRAKKNHHFWLRNTESSLLEGKFFKDDVFGFWAVLAVPF